MRESGGAIRSSARRIWAGVLRVVKSGCSTPNVDDAEMRCGRPDGWTRTCWAARDTLPASWRQRQKREEGELAEDLSRKFDLTLPVVAALVRYTFHSTATSTASRGFLGIHTLHPAVPAPQQRYRAEEGTSISGYELVRERASE